MFIYREIVSFITIQKLVNKLMSRNYYEYQSAETIKPVIKDKKTDTIIKAVQNQDEFNYIGI